MLDSLTNRIQLISKEWLEGSDVFVVEITASPNNQIQVFIDADSQVNISTCKTLSRHLEEKLEAEGLVGEKYVLDVSSAGDLPFKFKRQYTKNIGREIAVIHKDGIKQEGVLMSVAEDTFSLGIRVQKKSNKKQFELKETPIAFDSVKSVNIVFKF